MADAEAAGGSFALARRLQKWAEGQLEKLETDVGMTQGEAAAVGQRLSSTVKVLAHLTGQQELGRRILLLPMWKMLEAEMYTALKEHPDAAQAVADRLDRFERTWLGGAG